MRKLKLFSLLLAVAMIFNSMPAFAAATLEEETDPNNPKISITFTCVDGKTCDSMEIKSKDVDSLKIVMKGIIYEQGNVYTGEASAFDPNGWAVNGTDLYKFHVYYSYTPGARSFPEGVEPDYTGDVIGYKIELVPTTELPEDASIDTGNNMVIVREDLAPEYYVNDKQVTENEYKSAKTGAWSENKSTKCVEQSEEIIETDPVFTGLEETEVTRTWSDGSTDTVTMAVFHANNERTTTVTQKYRVTYKLTKEEVQSGEQGGGSDGKTVPEEGRPSNAKPASKTISVAVNSATASPASINKVLKAQGLSKSSVTTITIGKTVKRIKKGAFKDYKNAKTLVIKSKKLKKASVKGSLKGSAITKVKVKVGNAKTNKKYIKKYKKIFTKKNAGKAVKVS